MAKGISEVVVKVKRGSRGTFILCDIPGVALRKLDEAVPKGSGKSALVHLTLPSSQEPNKVKK